MIGALMDYGALCTKAKALYGKRLRLSDFERIAACHDVAEVAEYLRGHPAWSASSQRLSGGVYIGRVELELALWQQFREDYQSLLHFVPRQDRALMAFPLLLQEQRAILAALRRLQAGHPVFTPQAVVHSALDWKGVLNCTDFDGLIAAAERTIYGPALRRLRPSGSGLPDYATAEILLRSVYFSHMYRVIQHNYAGEVRKILLRSYGEQIDLLNLIHILRLKTYFPDQRDYLPLLFPFNYRLRPELIRQLCAAPDVDGVFALLKDTPYAKAFERVEVGEVEDYYRRAFYQFNRRQLTSGPPSVCAAVSYLNLKELELRALVEVVEAVKYGVPCNLSFAQLIGE